MRLRPDLLLSLLLGPILLFTHPPVTEAQRVVLPPVSLVLTLDVHDQHAWLGMQQEILTTPQESPRSLAVTILAPAAGGRTLVILTPMFTSAIRSTTRAITRVVVKGKVAGDHAQLVPFMQTFAESAGVADANKVAMDFGLATVTATLLELKVEDR